MSRLKMNTKLFVGKPERKRTLDPGEEDMIILELSLHY
jgi:hypothetical protein